jgi:riboflavin kinase/FMN adenylyltransferase
MNITIKGTVIAGNKIGRTLGFPTANIPLADDESVANGVYAALVMVEGEEYEAMLNVGRKPTIGDNEPRLAEAYLFGFDGNLYDKIVEIKPLWHLRDEQKFENINQLRLQIETDRRDILDYFNNL